MILGFTGTSRGMTPAQKQTIRKLILTCRPDEVRHGCCVGADAEFNAIVRGELPETFRVGHPCTISHMTARNLRLDRTEPVQPPLDRNREIVALTERLLATPKGFEEELRSGTWATIRYARRADKPLTIVWPDGGVKEEDSQVKDGLISLTELGAPTRAPVGRLPQCAACGLYRGFEAPRLRLGHPKMTEPAGDGRLKTLVVGEAPGETEDYRGKPFVGRAGRRLQEAMSRCGVALFDDCWVMNAAACRPVSYDRQLKRHENRPPTEKEISYCRPAVFAAIEELKPERIILLGGGAMVSVLGRLWKPFGLKGAVSRWNGWRIPCQELNAWVCPSYHPSHVLREDAEALNRVFDGQLRAAFAPKGRPFKKVPDYGKLVCPQFDCDDACDAIAEMAYGRLPIAVDYETSTLKPEGDGRILCVAVSDGSASLATPWRGKVPEVMKNILKNPKVKKIAANAKFEDRWTRAKLGTPVKGWLWDTMVAAHVLDNRRGVSGLKFQAFARLGQGEYDTHVDKFIGGEGGYGKNRLHDVDIRDLLFYCGMDSLLEYELARLQMKELGAQCRNNSTKSANT